MTTEPWTEESQSRWEIIQLIHGVCRLVLQLSDCLSLELIEAHFSVIVHFRGKMGPCLWFILALILSTLPFYSSQVLDCLLNLIQRDPYWKIKAFAIQGSMGMAPAFQPQIPPTCWYKSPDSLGRG